jgi:hypothetical protein
VKKDIHTANKDVHTANKDLHEIKEVLSHTAGGYIIRATLRAGIAKELPPPNP